MFLSPVDGLHGHKGVIEPEDLLVAFSRGGESDDVICRVEILNQRCETTIAFVHNTDSELARTCQHILPIKSKQEFELEGLLAKTSSVAFTSVCDALSAIICKEKNFTRDQFGETHPNGAVVKDILRS